jgi:hypothetical protein
MTRRGGLQVDDSAGLEDDRPRSGRGADRLAQRARAGVGEGRHVVDVAAPPAFRRRAEPDGARERARLAPARHRKRQEEGENGEGGSGAGHLPHSTVEAAPRPTFEVA